MSNGLHKIMKFYYGLSRNFGLTLLNLFWTPQNYVHAISLLKSGPQWETYKQHTIRSYVVFQNIIVLLTLIFSGPGKTLRTNGNYISRLKAALL